MLNSFETVSSQPGQGPPSRPSDSYDWYKEAQTTIPPYPVVPLQKLSYEQTRPKRDFSEQIRTLQQHYTILGHTDLLIKLLEEEPELYRLLLGAIDPLKRTFGEIRLIHLRVLSSDEDSFLKVAVQLPPSSTASAATALRSFDNAWWLDNCHRSGGALVFDYELQHAV